MHILARIVLPAILASAVAPGVALGQGTPSQNPLEIEDIRLARIAEGIMTANAGLCDNRMPVTGIVLHSADQYADGTLDERFSQGPVAIGALRPGSPADTSGLKRDDAIVAINGHSTTTLAAGEDGHLREAVFDLLASQPSDFPLALTIRRAGTEMDFSIDPDPGCRSLVEVRVGEGPRAQSDGRVIQIRYDFAREIDDTQLAVVFAHELAHTVLQHRRRKEEAGIEVGLLGEFGRNQRANREAEVEADRLSVHLLANAGFDPHDAPRFWRSETGRRVSGGMFSSFIYPSAESRAALIEREIAMYLPQARGPTWPGHLLSLRNRRFSRD